MHLCAYIYAQERESMLRLRLTRFIGVYAHARTQATACVYCARTRDAVALRAFARTPRTNEIYNI